MATKTGRPAKLVNPRIQAISFDGSKLEILNRLAHERSIEKNTNTSVSDLVREAVDAHYGLKMASSNVTQATQSVTH